MVLHFGPKAESSLSAIDSTIGKAILDLAAITLDDPAKSKAPLPSGFCAYDWKMNQVNLGISNELNNPELTYEIAALAVKGYKAWIGDRKNFRFPIITIRGEGRYVYGFMGFSQPPSPNTRNMQ